VKKQKMWAIVDADKVIHIVTRTRESARNWNLARYGERVIPVSVQVIPQKRRKA
jgi:hypothetical protein